MSSRSYKEFNNTFQSWHWLYPPGQVCIHIETTAQCTMIVNNPIPTKVMIKNLVQKAEFLLNVIQWYLSS